MSEQAKAFGLWLRTKRLERSLSMPQLAVLIGTNKQTINRWEKATPQTLTGKPSLPKREDVIELAKVLCADVNEALTVAGYAAEINIPEHLVIEGFEGLDQSDIDKIVDYIRFTKQQKKKNTEK